MTRRLSDMSEAQRAAYDAYQDERRKTGKRFHFHDEGDRMAMAYLGHLDLWPKAAVGRVFDTDRQCVQRAMTSYPRTSRGSISDEQEQ